MATKKALAEWNKAAEARERAVSDRREKHLVDLGKRLNDFLLDMFDIEDETDFTDLGADLAPLAPLTIGDLKVLMSAVHSELERLRRENEADAQVTQ